MVNNKTKEKSDDFMNNRIMMIIVAILLIAATIYSIYAIFNTETEIEIEEENGEYISEVIEDECTEEYEETQNATTVSSVEEKVAANAILILKKYFSSCDHTVNEYVELPQEIVNMTRKEVQAEYPDWEVIGFEAGQVILYKEFEEECGEHFKLKVEEGKIVIYLVNADRSENIYEKTNISSEYLTETDLLNMQDGLMVYGKEELNKIIEDFE